MVAYLFALALLEAAPSGAITQPIWQTKPTNKDIIKSWPSGARSIDYARVVLRCTAGDDGRLQACTAASETPAGYGFDLAALSLTIKFRLRPKETNGRPVAGRLINIPMVFRVAY
ncbi:hypothetical protein BH11PSE2_BH11PSE2_03490 [soil metagenome]